MNLKLTIRDCLAQAHYGNNSTWDPSCWAINCILSFAAEELCVNPKSRSWHSYVTVPWKACIISLVLHLISLQL